MPYGLEERHWQIVKKIAIDPLKTKNVSVWVFGSRARGDHKQYSDLDLLFESKDELPAGFLANIRLELEESSLPIKVELADRRHLAESYKKQIELEKVQL
ncbi:MAG: nucleotidyltransferase domain-containing protein [Bdellovibrionota bacterium]